MTRQSADNPLDEIADEINALGLYFTFEVHEGRSPTTDPWHRLTDLTDGSGALRARYERFRAALEASSGNPVEFRVAASTGHLALMARLICPAFGAALLGHRLDLAGGRWQDAIAGVMPLSFPAGPFDAFDAFDEDLLTGPIRALTELTVGMGVSPKVLWGNVSSAINGAAMAACVARPELATEALSLGRTFGESLGCTPGPDFRRTSCCLIYRIAPPGSAPYYCNDCVLQ